MHINTRRSGRGSDRQLLLGALLPGAWDTARRYHTLRQVVRHERKLRHLLLRDEQGQDDSQGSHHRPRANRNRSASILI